uniref:Putative sorting and assembly machinery sam50 protein n=1 Tax=Panstrongylus lignarius TaxID=156445 RepID=A0A224XJ05_9HEMI
MGTVYATSNPSKGAHYKKGGKNLNVMGIDPNEPPIGQGHPCDSGVTAEKKSICLQGIVARVDRVNFDGIIRTKQDILKHSVKELFTAQNFEDMIQKAHVVRGKLQNLGIFRNVGIHIDTSTGPKATPNGYEVTYEVVEMKRIFGGVTTQIANHGEALLVVNGVMPNLFGRAEALKAEYTYGSNRSNTLSCSLIKPFLRRGSPVLSSSVGQNDSEWPMSGYKLIERLILFDLHFNTLRNLKHNLQYEANWRLGYLGDKYASFELRETTGHSLKSSVRHIATVDYRDSKVFPTCGSMYKFISEFAGLGGTMCFLKNEGMMQFNIPFFSKDWVVQYSFNLGHMVDLKDVTSPICDNFFLGGPMSLRGFEFRSVCPAGEHYTGARMYWSTGLHIFTPLPFKPGSGGFGDLFRSHLWINCGNCGDWTTDDFQTFINEQKEETRMSAGIGIAFKLGQLARVEINYCFPIWALDHDKKVEGLQFGVGVHFL